MDAMDHAFIETLKVRVLAYLENPAHGRTKGHLMLELGLRKGCFLPSGLPESRSLDRALQELRKAGKIRFTRSQWFISDPSGS